MKSSLNWLGRPFEQREIRTLRTTFDCGSDTQETVEYPGLYPCPWALVLVAAGCLGRGHPALTPTHEPQSPYLVTVNVVEPLPGKYPSWEAVAVTV